MFCLCLWMHSFLWQFLLNGKFILCELHKILGTWRTVPKWYLIKSGQTCPGPNFFAPQLCSGITGQALTCLKFPFSKYLLEPCFGFIIQRMRFEIFWNFSPIFRKTWNVVSIESDKHARNPRRHHPPTYKKCRAHKFFNLNLKTSEECKSNQIRLEEQFLFWRM